MQSLLARQPITKERELKDLLDQLESFLDYQELVQYQITEDFPKNRRRTYTLYNLAAEVEKNNGEIFFMFDDLEHVLLDDYTNVLNMFLLKSVVEVGALFESDGVWRAKIQFKDGTITIERKG